MSQTKKSSLSPENFSVRNDLHRRTLALYYKGVKIHESQFNRDTDIAHGKTSLSEWQIKVAKGIREAIDRDMLPTNIMEEAQKVEDGKNYPINWRADYPDRFGDEDRPVSYDIEPGGLLDYIPPTLTWNIPDPHRIRGVTRDDE